MTIVKPKIVAAAAGVISLLIFISLASEMNRRWQVEREVQRLENEVRALEKGNIEVRNLNQYFQTPDYQERIAREQLNYRAPGEKVVLIPEDQVEVEVASNEIVQQELPPSIPGRWWQVFFVDETPFASFNESEL